MEHFKRSTARDFRINGATLEAALREESSDEEEDDELNADEQDEVSLNQRILATIITRREERWVELPFPKTSGTGEKLANRSAHLGVSSNDHRSPYRFLSGRVCGRVIWALGHNAFTTDCVIRKRTLALGIYMNLRPR